MSSHAEPLCKVRCWRKRYCQLFLILHILAPWVSFAVVLVGFKADLDAAILSFPSGPFSLTLSPFKKKQQSHQQTKMVRFIIKQWISTRHLIKITGNLSIYNIIFWQTHYVPYYAVTCSCSEIHQGNHKSITLNCFIASYKGKITSTCFSKTFLFIAGT